jgi:hypothetical protein
MQNSPIDTGIEASDWSKLSESASARANATLVAAERIGQIIIISINLSHRLL